MNKIHGVDVNDSMEQRSERHIYANFIRTDQIAGRKIGRITNVQVRDGDADSGKDARENGAKRDLASRVLLDGGSDGIAIAVHIQEKGQRENKKNQENDNPSQDFCPER